MEFITKNKFLIAILVLLFLMVVTSYFINEQTKPEYLDLTNECKTSCTKNIKGFGKIEIDGSRLEINTWPSEMTGTIKQVHYMKNALLVVIDDEITIFDDSGKSIFNIKEIAFSNELVGNIIGDVKVVENEISFKASAVTEETVKFPLYEVNIYDQASWHEETATIVEEDYALTYNYETKKVTTEKQNPKTIADFYIAKFGSLDVKPEEPIILTNQTEVNVEEECTASECRISVKDFGDVIIKNSGELEDSLYISGKLVSSNSSVITIKTVGDTLVVVKHVGSDISGTSISAYTKEGVEIFNYKDISFPSNEKGYITNPEIGNTIKFRISLVFHEGFNYQKNYFELSEKNVWSKVVPENLVVDGTCSIEYLGNGKFSNLKFISGKTLIELYESTN